MWNKHDNYPSATVPLLLTSSHKQWLTTENKRETIIEKFERGLWNIDTASQKVHFVGKKDPVTLPEEANSMGH